MHLLDITIWVAACTLIAVPWMIPYVLPRQSKARVWSSVAAVPLSIVLGLIALAIVAIWFSMRAGTSV